MIKRWNAGASSTGGKLASTPAAAMRSYSRPSLVLNSPIATGTVLAGDGQWFIVGVGSDNIWRKFCDLAGLSALRDDPRYATNAERVRNRDALLPQVRAAVGSRPAAEWIQLLQENGIPTGPIRTVEEALADPQVAARAFVVELAHPVLGPVKSLATPIHFSGDGVSYTRHPPLLGEQTDEVLAELGLSAQEIGDLHSRGVV